MTTAHSIFQFIGGDDWEISATLLDENDNPYNLTGATIKWTLVDNAGRRVLDDDDIAISIISAAAGTCLIMVASTKTTTIPGGRYSDALRIIKGGVTSTLSLGPVQVITDPWAVAIQPAILRLVVPAAA
jgi:hypothetical protein